MKAMRKLSAALVMAAFMSMGLGTANLEAAKPGKGNGRAAICDYLEAVMSYENVSPAIYAWAASLYDYFECGQ